MAFEVPPLAHRVDPDALCLGCLSARPQAPICSACGYDERAPTSSPLHLLPRTILHGQYLLGRVLGQGGFGITYLAWDLNLEVPLAIKEFLPTDFASRSSGQLAVTPYGDDGRSNFEYGLDAFEREARTIASFQGSPGAVDVLNYFRENGTGYIVMHYLPGRTFRDHLKQREAPLVFEEAMAVVRPMLLALQAVHQRGLVHRDISPDNIYICDTGRVCLLDFGGARQAVRERSRSLSVQFKSGYSPEEQYRRHGEQGPWTDVYAAAGTLYRAITGVLPPPALDRLQEDPLRPPGALGVTMPRAAERALMRALAVYAAQRYQTVDEFLDGLGMPVAANRAAAMLSGDPSAGMEMSPRGSPAAGGFDGFSGALADLGRSLVAAVRWSGAAIADTARLVRHRLDGALQQGGGVARERHIREQLAALWPITLVQLSLRDPYLPAGPDHGPFDVFVREDTRTISFDAIVQNNFAGIHPLRGNLGVLLVDPRGTVGRTEHSTHAFTLEIPLSNLVDRDTVASSWGPDDPHGFAPGAWRIELWWDGRKIGERGFVISL